MLVEQYYIMIAKVFPHFEVRVDMPNLDEFLYLIDGDLSVRFLLEHI